MRRIAALLLLASCSLAPRYERPAAPVPARLGEGSRDVADLGWRQVLGDARLLKLVGLALEHNRDLRIAALTVEQTAAQYQIQRSELLPTVAGLGSAEVAGNFEGDTTQRYALGVGIVSYELDLFGRVRSLKDAALEEYLASEAAHRSVHLALVAQVAQQYLAERALAEELEIARQTVVAVSEAYTIANALFQGGQRSELDVRTAESQVASARAEVARLELARQRAENALVVLVGQPLPAGLPEPGKIETLAIGADLPAGLSSEVLLRRPDILAAEHTLRAANASIGAARAAFFPTISLTGSAGLSSTSLSNLFSSDALGWSFSPQITLPIFTGGRNQAALDVAKVRKRIEIARYEQAIQVAFREVADALAGRAWLDQQLEFQLAAVEAARKRYAISEARYRSGIESYLVVVTAQRDLYAAEQQLVEVRLARLTNAIDLYKALGGGWKA